MRFRGARPFGPALAVVAIFLAFSPTTTASSDPSAANAFAIFTPTVIVTPKDQDALDSGRTVERVLPGYDKQVAVFVAVAVHANGDRLVDWVRKIAQMRKSQYVVAIQRFSDPPRLSDLAALSLDDKDLDDIRGCSPGDCGCKMSAAEMERLHRVVEGNPNDWRGALQTEFRQIVFDRATRYLADGHAGLAPLADKKPPVSLGEAFSSIIGQSPFLTTHVHDFAAYLDRYPHGEAEGVESFLYWSKDHLGGKPQISVTQVAIIRGGPQDPFDALVAGKQVFATHYTDASLSVTALLRDQSDGRSYLAYLNRTDLDMIHGLFGGLVRHVVQRRLSSEGPAVLINLRQRLESGEPK